MKFKRIGIVTLISGITLASLVGLSSTKAEETNKKMNYVDYSGDREMLKGITFENIIQVGGNKFEKVILHDYTTGFQETKFDRVNWATELELNNRELFRGKYNPPFVENKDEMLTVCFNPKFPYADDEAYIEVAKKDKDTGKLEKVKTTFNNFTINEHFYNEKLFELNGKYYYTVQIDNYGRGISSNRIYMVKDNLQVEEVVNIESNNREEGMSTSPFVTDGQQLYFFSYNDKIVQLVVINPVSKKVDKKDVSYLLEELGGIPWINDMTIHDGVLYVAGETMTETIFAMDLKTMTLKKDATFSTTLTEKLNANVTPLKMLVKDKKLVVLYKGYDVSHDNTYVVVFNTVTGKSLYEGMLPTMKNRGVGREYMMY